MTLDGTKVSDACATINCQGNCNQAGANILRIDDCLDIILDNAPIGTAEEKAAIKACYNSQSVCCDCFSADCTVQVEGHTEPVFMKDLKVGDKVLTAANKYEQVYAFAHKDHEGMGSYVAIDVVGESTNGREHSIEISPEHLIYIKSKESPIRADEVQVGDELISETKEVTTVKCVKIISKAGIYSPLTPDGTIIVNGYKASSYVGLQALAPLYASILGRLGISQEMMNHMWFSPLRMMCMGVSTKTCEQYTTGGIHTWGQFGMTLVGITNGVHWSVRPFVMGGIVSLLALSLAVEYTIGSMIRICMLASVVTFFFLRRHVSIKSKEKTL